MRTRLFRRRSIRHRQRLLAFVERAMRRERWFKRAIALLTLLVLVMLVTVPRWGLHLFDVDRRLGEASLQRGAAHQQVPRRDRRRLADVPGSGDRGDPAESAASLRRLRAGLPALVALCRDGSRPWPVALGQLRLDDPPVVEGVRGGRPGPIVSIAAADPIGLAEESRDRERDAGVLPRAGRARPGRGPWGYDGRRARSRRGRRPTRGACAGPSPNPMPRSAVSSWATRSCRGCSSATTRPRPNACAAICKRE